MRHLIGYFLIATLLVSFIWFNIVAMRITKGTYYILRRTIRRSTDDSIVLLLDPFRKI